MGKSMNIKNPDRVVEGMARDGREFGHVTENLRDGLLASASAIEFGVLGLEDSERACVARRYIADDGSGMNEKTLRQVYADFGDTGTDQDFEVILDADGNTTVTVIPVEENDNRHKRRGLGGRSSLLVWNPLGVVTVTLQDGVARQVHNFRSIEGDFQMRNWNEDGKRALIVPPYEEPEWLSVEDLTIDLPFARQLLVRSGIVETEDEADDYIAEMTEKDELVENPLAGIDWAAAVPHWVVARWDETTGLAYRADGTLAHGTVKFLLGDSPTHSTAITGDPGFPNEAVPARYDGAVNSAWLDLKDWDVRVWTLVKETASTIATGQTGYDIVGYPHRFVLNGGKPRSEEETPTGRQQIGAVPQRLRQAIVLQKVLDLGKFGSALLLVSDKPETKTGRHSKWAASRKDGIVAVAYGNELHGLVEASNLHPAEYQYRAMAVPTMGYFHERVSIVLFPPRASETTEGVYQALARDNLKWTGYDRLPLSDEGGIFEAIRNALPDELFALVEKPEGDNDYKVDQSRYKHLKDLVSYDPASTAVGKPAKAAEPKGKAALIAKKRAEDRGEDVGNFGKSGDTPRPKCPECGQMPHAEDCKLKPETSHPAGEGGPRGARKRLAPDDRGRLTGRKSRAKVTPPTPKPEPEDVHLEAPDVVLVETALDDDGRWPAVWERMGAFEEGKTGVVSVYRQHRAVDALFHAAHKGGRYNADEVDAFVARWISRKISDAVMGALALADVGLDLKKPKSSSFGLEEMANYLGDKQWWMLVVASMVADTASLTAYVKGNASLAKGKRAA